MSELEIETVRLSSFSIHNIDTQLPFPVEKIGRLEREYGEDREVINPGMDGDRYETVGNVMEFKTQGNESVGSSIDYGRIVVEAYDLVYDLLHSGAEIDEIAQISAICVSEPEYAGLPKYVIPRGVVRMQFYKKRR